MHDKSIGEINSLEDVKLEISKTKNRLSNLPKNIPKEVFMLVGFAVVFPFIPGKRGRKPIIENWEYSHSLIFVSIIFTIIYIITYHWRKDKLEKRARDLKLKQHLLEKENLK